MVDSKKNSDLSHEFKALYTELKDLAEQVWRSNPSATLNRTALVNEAFVRLSRSKSAAPVDRQHFRRLAASAMRKILVDAARRRQALKRGDGWEAVTAESQADPAAPDIQRLLALDLALEKLAEMAPRQAELVELRFFSGLEVIEAAEALGISASAAARDWRAARAWLSVELGDVTVLDADEESDREG